MRPEFIPSDKFRAWLKTAEINKYAMVDGVLPSSYIARAQRDGNPIRSCDGKHRLIDIVARARAFGHEVSLPPNGPVAVLSMRMEADALRDHIASLAAQKAILESQLHQTETSKRLAGVAESITGKTLLRECEIVGSSVPVGENCGVYFLIKDSRIVYVGQSINVHGRIAEHRRYKEFDRFCFIRCEKENLDVLESLYIHVFRPELNGVQFGAPIAPISFDDLLGKLAN